METILNVNNCVVGKIEATILYFPFMTNFHELLPFRVLVFFCVCVISCLFYLPVSNTLLTVFPSLTVHGMCHGSFLLPWLWCS